MDSKLDEPHIVYVILLQYLLTFVLALIGHYPGAGVYFVFLYFQHQHNYWQKVIINTLCWMNE